ncbi:quinol:cytochrome C oxidoreductase [uncultured Tenacibaculum sp.]|uniref:quinol:cytochrome C oxidoreductase n=1 Tax=uncultured Tenacibaculum sp. TaxID=174713 RepID=UPI002612AD3A|nr:quinol:cytochrome C oxidoreductase [uncultured Tenacibaculum sp.]
MYQFSGKLKMLAIGLMVLGLIGTAISFMNTPKTLQDAKDILAKQEASHHGAHGGGHGEATKEHHGDAEHKTVEHKENAHKDDHKEVKADSTAHTNDHKETKSDSTSHKEEVAHSTEHTEEAANHAEDTRLTDSLNGHVTEKAHVDTSSHAGGEHHAEAGHHGDDHHAEYAFHQMQNKPWSAIYVSLIFFLGISLLVMAFYAAQRVAHAGWSVVLFRVMEAITANLHYVSVIMLIFIIVTAMHMNHLFPWMAEGVFDPLSENYDPIVDGKKWFMNLPGWVMRSIFYLLVWNGFRYFIRRKSIEQDNGDLALHKKIYNTSVVFILLFMITESMMSWDWIMGIDPHWFSTLFGWYVLATLLVSALTVICLVTLYLRSKGHLPFVNDSHIHDLAKFMFGFSVFWTYLWFAQFMLIWYADMPEETTYFALRFKEYVVPFIGMIALNFIFPILLLINSDFKTVPWVIVIAGVFILVGHYVDLFVMIMPGTVGSQWGFGIGEISAFLFFLGLFIFATFNAFAKANPVVKGNPFLHESEIHHYYIIEHRGEDNAHH